jgi:hypothetical protein
MHSGRELAYRFRIVVPRVLLAATFEVSARLASLLARRDVLDVETSLNVVTAIRKATTTPYDVVVLDLSLRGAFLLLDMLRTIDARQRPLVIALRGDEQERAILDSDVVTAVLAASQVEMSGDVIIQLARVGARRRTGAAPGSTDDDGFGVRDEKLFTPVARRPDKDESNLDGRLLSLLRWVFPLFAVHPRCIFVCLEMHIPSERSEEWADEQTCGRRPLVKGSRSDQRFPFRNRDPAKRALDGDPAGDHRRRPGGHRLHAR